MHKITRRGVSSLASLGVAAGALVGVGVAAAPAAHAQSYTAVTNSTSSIGGVGIRTTGNCVRRLEPGQRMSGTGPCTEPDQVQLASGYVVIVRFLDGSSTRLTGTGWKELRDNVPMTVTLRRL